MSHKKFGPDRFSLFVVIWIQTNKHPDKLNFHIYLHFHKSACYFNRETPIEKNQLQNRKYGSNLSLIRERFKGSRCKSDMPLYTWRDVNLTTVK